MRNTQTFEALRRPWQPKSRTHLRSAILPLIVALSSGVACSGGGTRLAGSRVWNFTDVPVVDARMVCRSTDTKWFYSRFNVRDDPKPEDAIVKLLPEGRRIWVVRWRGIMEALDVDTRTVRAEGPDGLVVDAAVAVDGTVLALVAAERGEQASVWRHETEGRWSRISHLPEIGCKRLIGMSRYRDGLVAVTERWLYLSVDGRTWHGVALRTPLDEAPWTAVACSDEACYAALNRGEFGGGVYRIEVPSARVVPIKLQLWSESINGLVPDPTRRNCVLASFDGITYGSVGRICDTSAQVLLGRPTPPPPAASRRADGAPVEPWTEPFLSVAAERDVIVATTERRIFVVRERETTTRETPAHGMGVGGLTVSFEMPGVVLVDRTIPSSSTVRPAWLAAIVDQRGVPTDGGAD